MGDILTRGGPLAGVVVEPRRWIPDERGSIRHVLRSDWGHFQPIGEIYISTVRPGVIKGWKRHRVMIQHYAVPVGEIRLVIHDDRLDSNSRGHSLEVITGADRYGLVRIPAGVWYAFKGLAAQESMIVNCASQPHDPSEVESIPLDSLRAGDPW